MYHMYSHPIHVTHMYFDPKSSALAADNLYFGGEEDFDILHHAKRRWRRKRRGCGYFFFSQRRLHLSKEKFDSLLYMEVPWQWLI